MLGALFLLALCDGGAEAPAPEPRADFVLSEFRVPREGTVLALRDVDGDGRLDLLELDGAGVGLRRQGADGRFEPEPSAGFPWPAERVAWDLADLTGDGRTEVLVLDAQQGVRSFALGPDGAFEEGRLVLAERAWLPRGAFAVRFARDVDGDGRADLVLPGPRSHRIFLSRPEGTFAGPIEIAYRAAVELSVGDPGRLDSRLGREVRVPWFRIEDLDGDGHPDLVSQTPERVAFHLAQPGQDPVLAPEPTWVLDLEELRAQLPRRAGFDLDDLLENVPPLVDWRVADLDGEPPHDLVVAVGNRFRVYSGGARSGPRETPDQLLLAGGKVLGFYLRPVLDGPLPDLQLLRGERISLGRALRYLVLPGRLDFEVFTYANEGGRFSRRPTRRGTLGLAIPRLLAFIEEAERLGDSLAAQFQVPALRIAFGADGRADDVLDLIEGELAVFEDCAPSPLALEGLVDREAELSEVLEALALRELDRRGDGAELVFDLAALDRYDFAPGVALRRAREGRAPSARAPFEPLLDPALRVLDLDGDGRDDVLAWGHRDGLWVARLYVRVPGT